MSGKVTLVGAGPGDPGLLTVKGLRALEQAEVVVYDRLGSPAVLELIPSAARRIDVGKQASRHPVPQHRINRILLEEALAGNNVVRLKAATRLSSDGEARNWKLWHGAAQLSRKFPESPPPSRRRPTEAFR